MESTKNNYIYICLSILFGILLAFLVYFILNREIFFNNSNIDVSTHNATKALIENLTSTHIEKETISSKKILKNKKQDDIIDISKYLDETDTTKTDNQEKNKDDIKAKKDADEAFDALLNQPSEEQKAILEGNNNSIQELAKNNFIVIDPSDKEESIKKQKIDSSVSDDEPNTIKPNDILTKPIEGVVGNSDINDDINDDIDIGNIETDAIEAENNNADDTVDIDVNDIEKKQKNTPVSDNADSIASSIDAMIMGKKPKDAKPAVPDAAQNTIPDTIPDAINQAIGDKLSLPPELFDVSTLHGTPKQETGIIPTDTIMGTRRGNNKNIYTIENKPVQQPAEQQQIPTTPQAINLENKDFKCHFKHLINMVEKTEIFKLTLTPMSQTEQPINMQVKKNLQLYQYLNMSLENTDNYPSEFAVLKNFCKTIIVEKSVSEDY